MDGLRMELEDCAFPLCPCPEVHSALAQKQAGALQTHAAPCSRTARPFSRTTQPTRTRLLPTLILQCFWQVRADAPVLTLACLCRDLNRGLGLGARVGAGNRLCCACPRLPSYFRPRPSALVFLRWPFSPQSHP